MGTLPPPLTVFIADDSPPVAEMMTELLSVPGRIEVVGVGESEAACMEAIARMRPDVVVLDLELKGGSGTQVLRAIRANSGLDAVQVMIASNHASPQLRAGCLELGANAYFDKVKELGELTASLARLADEKAARS